MSSSNTDVEKFIIDGADFPIVDPVARTAEGTSFNNTGTTLSSTNTESAIKEVNNSLTQKTPYILPTQTLIDDNFTSGTEKKITITTDGWYYLLALNETSGNCSATIYNNSDISANHIISTSPTVAGAWIRATSNLIPLKAGSEIWCRAFFTQHCYFYKLG